MAILALAGCSYFFAPRVELQRLTLDVAARANDDSPIAVDFVAVKDAELFKEQSQVARSPRKGNDSDSMNCPGTSSRLHTANCCR